MNEAALRALIRETVARQLNAGDATPRHDPPFAPNVTFVTDPSHYRYANLPDAGGPCLIEPAVACNHCGYCQSHGH